MDNNLNSQLNKLNNKFLNNRINNKPSNNPQLPVRNTGPYYAITPQAINCSDDSEEQVLQTYLHKTINERGPAMSAFKYGSNGPVSSAATSENTISPQTSTHGFIIYSFYFDSISRNQLSNYTNGEIMWVISNLNNNNPITNIIGVRLSPFLFPNINNNNSPNIFYFSRVYVDIYSLPSGYGILAENTTRFHFECAVSNMNSQAIILTPINDTFYITYPITTLSNFNVRFMINNMTPGIGGFVNLNLPYENVTVTSSGGNPMVFSINGQNTTILGDIQVFPSGQGIAVFLSNFNSNDTNLNYLVNSPSGLFVTEIINISSFSIGSLDGSTISIPFTANMYIPKNKISITASFISLSSDITNNINVVNSI